MTRGTLLLADEIGAEEGGEVCWLNPGGLFDDFTRALDTSFDDTAHMPSPTGCSSHGSYTWLNGVFNDFDALTTVLDGGLHWGRTNVNGFTFGTTTFQVVYLPLDLIKSRIEFVLQLQVPTWSELHNKSSQNQSACSINLSRYNAPFIPEPLLSQTPLLDVGVEVRAYSGTKNPGPAPIGVELDAYADNYNGDSGFVGDLQLATGQNDFSAGVACSIDIDDATVQITIGAHVETFTIDVRAPTDPDQVFTWLSVGCNMVNFGTESWGRPQSDDADFKVRISDFRITSDAGNCVLVPPGSSYLDRNGNCEPEIVTGGADFDLGPVLTGRTG